MGISRFFVHTVSVEQFEGVNAAGDVFAPAVVLAPPNGVFFEDDTKLTRSAKGDEVASTSTLYTSVANVALFTPDARVTTELKTARVVSVKVHTSGALNLPDHLEVQLI